MGHAAFERTKEDRRAYKAQLRKEEALWAQLASPVAIKHKEVDASKGSGLLRKGRSSSSRALGSNPRARGTNPSAIRANASV